MFSRIKNAPNGRLALWGLFALAIVVSVTSFAFQVYSNAALNRSIDQSYREREALAEQVRDMGGEPIVEPTKKPDTGPLNGTDGIDGEDGEDGVQGPPGAQGERGPKGDKGDRGSGGTDGSDGAQGSAGADGLNGADGAPGEPGPQGEPGPVGPAGPKGDTGPAGPAGADGKDGADGDDAPPPTQEQVNQAVAAYCSANPDACRPEPVIGTN